jgi:hypothetical protein
MVNVLVLSVIDRGFKPGEWQYNKNVDIKFSAHDAFLG